MPEVQMYDQLLGPAAAVVAAIVGYLKSRGASKGAEAAIDALGKKTGEGFAKLGSEAFEMLHKAFVAKQDTKALRALQDSEAEPDGQDYSQKLTEETARVASAHEDFASDLKAIAGQISIGLSSSGSVNIGNFAPNQGQQGIFNAPIYSGGKPPGSDGPDRS